MNSSPFPIRGLIEGFYGAYYTHPERLDMIRFLGGAGFNLYLYAPKNDRQHRARWWEPYPKAILDHFAECISLGSSVGVTFGYAISFGIPMNYSSQQDFDLILAKFSALFDRGCRTFGILVDDIAESFAHDSDRQVFSSVAAAHADLCNRVLSWLNAQDPDCMLYMCPTQYHGRPPFGPYLHQLGAHLDPSIEVFYTGRDVCSKTITVSDAKAFCNATNHPPVVWDNYPTNDLQMRAEMHVGPLKGRDENLADACSGYVANTMNQAEASKIPLLTIAEYLQSPHSYEPNGAWRRALATVGGEESVGPLLRFAENSLKSALQKDGAPHMDRLVREALAELRAGKPVSRSSACEALARYLDVLDESCYHLKNRMHNVALRANLLPWIEALEEKLWMGRRALQTLQTLETGDDAHRTLHAMKSGLADFRRSRKRIGGEEVVKLARYVDERVKVKEATNTPANTPDLDAATAAEVDAANAALPTLRFHVPPTPVLGPPSGSAGPQ